VRTTVDRPARRRRPASSFAPLVAAAVGLLLLAVAVPNVGPALRAARAEGTPGTFTAERLSCVQHPGHEACTWYGSFRPDDGPSRADVTLYGGRHGLDEGDRTAAIDIGRTRRVYPPSGSREWIATGLVLLAGLALLVLGGRSAWSRHHRPPPD
jgi:hypothetical protein